MRSLLPSVNCVGVPLKDGIGGRVVGKWIHLISYYIRLVIELVVLGLDTVPSPDIKNPLVCGPRGKG